MHVEKNESLTTVLLGFTVIGLCLFGCATNTTLDVAPAPVPGSSGDVDLGKLIESIRVKEGLPALAAAVIINGKIDSTAAVGTRKLGTANWVTVNDKLIIGSCGKTFTATLAAILVEEGRLSWNTTIRDVFPDLKMLPAYETINNTTIIVTSSRSTKKLHRRS